MCARAALLLALCPALCTIPPDLERLAFHFGTDKSHDDHKYTDLYAMLFAPLRNTARNITEIGIATGQSLRLWNDYFPQAHIWGIDVNPKQLLAQGVAFTANAPRVHLLLGEVTKPSEVESLGFSLESMDVIIDDGPHSSGPNERILVNMWPYLKPGGYYCVEDIQTGIDDMAATQSTASGAGVPGKPGWAYLAHGMAEGRMGERARQILQEHSAGPTLRLRLSLMQTVALPLGPEPNPNPAPDAIPKPPPQDHDTIFVDTLVGHRAHAKFLSRLGKRWAKDGVSHNSHVLVIRKREVA